MNSKMKIWIAMIAVYLVWGSTYLAIRFVVETIPPFISGGVRFIIAGLLLYVWQRASGVPVPTGREWRAAAVVGLFLLLGGNGGVVWAEQYIPSGIAALLVGSTPLWMVLLDSLRQGGKNPGWLIWTGVLIGFTGVILLAAPWETGSTAALNPLGMSALLIATITWAVGSLYSRGAPLPRAPLMATGAEMLTGGLGLVAAGTFAGEWARLDLTAVTTRSWLGWFYLIFVGSLIGFVAYTWLLRNAPTPLVATYAYVNPLVAIFLGSILGQEQITSRIVFSAAMIIGAVVIINFARFTTANSSAVIRTEGK